MFDWEKGMQFLAMRTAASSQMGSVLVLLIGSASPVDVIYQSRSG